MKTLRLVTLFQIFIFFNGGLGLSLFGQCSERNCYLPNGVFMDYPFGGHPGCGHPDFQLVCHGEDYPVIKINDTEYKVNQVSYPERTLRVVDKTAISSYCYLPNSNLNDTIPPFQMLPHSTLMFFVQCKSHVHNYSQVNCTTNSYLVFADNDVHIAQAVNYAHSSNCTSIFQVATKKLEPVDYTTTLTPDKYSREAINIMIKGFWIKWDLDTEYDSKCRVCNSSDGMCGYNVSDPRQFLCHCQDSHSNPHSCFNESSSGNRSKTLIIASCVGGVSAVMAAVALYIILWLRKKRIAAASIANGSSEFGFTERDIHIPNLPEFTYQELQQATNFFDKSRELGDGGFGTVYLGKLSDGRTVAVKKLHENNSKRLEQFVNEARILSSVRHPNLVRLFGYCHERQNLLLVYEYVSNGTLFHHLHGKNRESRMISESLLWRTRLNIALETANALAYLHFSVEPAIFHRDVKSTNILLDEDMHVKVADFGLSRFVALNSTHISTLPQGTPGYLDPGYYQSFLLTDRSDVYSFGVVLVELISGKKAVDTARDIKEIGLAHLAISKIQSGALHEIVDPDLGFEYEPLVKAMVTGVAELAFICLAMEKDDRPCMMEVVTQLHRIKQMGYGCPDCQSHVLGRIKGEAMCGRIDKFVLPCSANSVQAEAICRKFDKLALPCSGNSVQAEVICKKI